jgi:hypothetical protein
MSEKEAAALSNRPQYQAGRSPAYRQWMATPDHYLAAFDPEVIATIESFLAGEIQRLLKRARTWQTQYSPCLNRRLTSAAPASVTARTPRLLPVSRLRKRQPPRRNWHQASRKKEPITQPSQPSSAKRASEKRSGVRCAGSSQKGGLKWLVG